MAGGMKFNPLSPFGFSTNSGIKSMLDPLGLFLKDTPKVDTPAPATPAAPPGPGPDLAPFASANNAADEAQRRKLAAAKAASIPSMLTTTSDTTSDSKYG